MDVFTCKYALENDTSFTNNIESFRDFVTIASQLGLDKYNNYYVLKNEKCGSNVLTPILNCIEVALEKDEKNIDDYLLLFSCNNIENVISRRGTCSNMSFAFKNTNTGEEDKILYDINAVMCVSDIDNFVLIGVDENYCLTKVELNEIKNIDSIYLSVPLKNTITFFKGLNGEYDFSDRKIQVNSSTELYAEKEFVTEEEFDNIDTNDVEYYEYEKETINIVLEIIMISKERLKGYELERISINNILNNKIVKNKLENSNTYRKYKEEGCNMCIENEDIKMKSFEKRDPSEISISNDEEISNIMKKYDYTYEKLINEIFIPIWKKRKTECLFGNETTKKIMREITDIIKKRDLITIKLIR